MCGRYYVDDETAREIEKVVREIDRKLKVVHTGDVYPSQAAAVLTGKMEGLKAEQMNWGFPGYQRKGLLINARAEDGIGTENVPGQCAAQTLYYTCKAFL